MKSTTLPPASGSSPGATRFRRVLWLVVCLAVLAGITPTAAADEPPAPDRRLTTLPVDDPSWSLRDEYATFTRPVARSTANRPDETTGPKVRIVYVVPSFATDRQRDVSGELAQMAFFADEWLDSQNGGFGLRFDTWGGALDVGYLPLDVTPEQWASFFTPDPVYGVARAQMQEILIANGWPLRRKTTGLAVDPVHGDDLYFLVDEAPAGADAKTGAGAGSCRPTIDALNAGIRIVGAAVTMADGTPCPVHRGRFPTGGTPEAQQDWFGTQPLIDHVVQAMRFLPGCGYPVTPRDGELYTVPGTSIVEIRGGFMRDLLEPHDPLAARMRDAAPGAVPALDVRHDTYFRITSDRNAGLACNSDISRSPLWNDVPLESTQLRLARRSLYDRPDEASGLQWHAVYAVARGATDRRFDTNGQIESALRQFDRWLRIESGGTGSSTSSSTRATSRSPRARGCAEAPDSDVRRSSTSPTSPRSRVPCPGRPVTHGAGAPACWQATS